MKRIDGLVVIGIAFLYGLGGAGITESTVGIQSRVASTTFPLMVALLIAICGVIMLFRSDGVDHSQVWPSAHFWKHFIILTGTLIVYGLLFETFGFLVANTLLCVYLGMLLKSRWIPSLGTGLLISLTLFILFSIILEINLPFGLFGFMEDWIYAY